MPTGYSTPIYSEGGQAFLIDSCEPQIRAIKSGKIQMHSLTHGHYPGRMMPTELLPGLSSIGFWDSIGVQDWGLDPHRNEGIELVLLETGVMGFEVDGNQHRLRAGNLTITRPWQLHCLGDPHIRPGRLHWLIIDVGVRRPNQEWHWPPWVILNPADLRELTLKLRQTTSPVWHATPEIIGIFQAIAPYLKRGDFAHYESRLRIYLNHLLIALLDVLRAQTITENPALLSRGHTVELFLKDLAENPSAMSEEWTLESMAGQCGVSSTTFVKYCQAQTNTSPMDYLNRCRLECAARRLQDEPATPITRIASDCGFSTSQYFATRFATYFHVTPREYRSRSQQGEYGDE